VKGLAPLACKTDRIDAWVLAELSRRELVPAIWLPDPAVRAERERARFRLHLCLFSDQPLEERSMTATYTFDVFSSLDGFGGASGDWTGYWGKQGPELLDHRLALQHVPGVRADAGDEHGGR